jgi:hypothetical protein
MALLKAAKETMFSEDDELPLGAANSVERWG